MIRSSGICIISVVCLEGGGWGWGLDQLRITHHDEFLFLYIMSIIKHGNRLKAISHQSFGCIIKNNIVCNRVLHKNKQRKKYTEL